MDRRTKASLNRDKAICLQAQWGIDARQVRYSDDGHWYATLRSRSSHCPCCLTPTLPNQAKAFMPRSIPPFRPVLAIAYDGPAMERTWG